ncbi:hypothetical protein LTS15_004608 [Exophiala xenobiotica]|nr:hypothetical protein LTS15_004608 [Exophiala xenobiotica]
MSSFLGNALITGAGSGIGRAVVTAFAKSGAKGLAIADIRAEGLDETEKLLSQGFPNVRVLKLVVDVADQAAVERMVSSMVAELGTIDCAVNAAAMPPARPYKLAEVPVEDFDRLHNVNTRGLFLCMKAEITAMLKQEPRPREPGAGPTGTSSLVPPERGTIVNLASLAGVGAVPGMTAYVASKHAVIGLTRTAALDYGRLGIRINAICPNYIATPMITDLLRNAGTLENEESNPATVAFLNMLATKNPSGRIGYPEEVADACVFMAGSQSTYINGHPLIIDGGIMVPQTITIHSKLGLGITGPGQTGRQKTTTMIPSFTCRTY